MDGVLPACRAGWSARSGAPPRWRSAPWAAGSSDPRLSDACVITRHKLLSKSQHEHTDEQRTNQGPMQMEIGSKSVEQKH